MIRKEKLQELKSLMEEMKYVSMEKIEKETHFLHSDSYLVRLKNGMVFTREKLWKGKSDGSAVMILPIKKNGDVILTVEPRVFSKHGVGIGFPSGYIEVGEEAKHATLRELREETGYTCSEVISLGGFYQDLGCSSAYNELFLGWNAEKTTDPEFDDGEIVSTFECHFEEVLEFIQLGYINGCNELITLQRAEEYVKRKSKI